MDAAQVTIRPMTAGDAEAAAGLHVSQISGGFLSTLDRRAVARIYRTLPKTAAGFGFVAEQAGQVGGFISCATHLGRLYRGILLRQGVPLAWRLSRHLFSPRVVRKMFQTLLYPRKVSRGDLPAAEILSVATGPALRGQGVGARLMVAAVDEFLRRGCRRVKVLVGANLGPANAYYRRHGFVLVSSIRHHGRDENIYVLDLHDAAAVGAGLAGAAAEYNM